MQRATAATPLSQRGGTQQSPSSEPALKRQKIHDAGTPPSHSVSSTPGGTPYVAENNSTQPRSTALPDILRRGGRSTFTRGEGADTEWVLDVKLPEVAPLQNTYLRSVRTRSHGAKGGNISGIPGLGEVDDNDDTSEDEDADEEDIWHDQPSGRQTYGSFKRKSAADRKRDEAGTDHDHDEDLSSGSDSSGPDSDSDECGSDSDSGSGSMSISGSDDEDAPRATKTKQKTEHSRDKKQHRASAAAAAASAENSDEEMRRVRREIEQKHDRMAGLAGKRGPGASGGGGGNGGRSTGRAAEGGGGFGGNNSVAGRKRQRGPNGYDSRERDQRGGFAGGYADIVRRSKKARKTI